MYFNVIIILYKIYFIAGYCAKIKGRVPWYCDSGVWVGIHGPYRGFGQHVPFRSSSSLWSAKHWGPDYFHQWNQPGWPPFVVLSNLY